jgi:hypothetical protein
MNSMPKVIATIEDEIAKLETILNDVSRENHAIASEQAGLKKLLPFAKEIARLQAKFEQNLRERPPPQG